MGGLLGIDRGMKNRPAGLRTFMLLSMGSAIVMITNQFLYQVYHTGDPARLGAQVISGIGFIGAGSIIVTTRNQIKGLTTAAGLWACACVGLAIGIGLYEVAVFGTVCIFFVLTLLREVDTKMRKRTRQLYAYCELDKGIPLHKLIEHTRAQGLQVLDLQFQSEASASDLTALTVTLRSDSIHKYNHEEIMELMRKLDGLSYIEEL